MSVWVSGCVVNGPGEALMTDIGFTGGGRGTHQVYIKGVPDHRLKDDSIVDHLVELVEARAAEIEAAKAAEEAAAEGGIAGGRITAAASSSAFRSRSIVTSLQPVRGTRDILPDEMRHHRVVVETARALAARYGYHEMEIGRAHV